MQYQNLLDTVYNEIQSAKEATSERRSRRHRDELDVLRRRPLRGPVPGGLGEHLVAVSGSFAVRKRSLSANDAVVAAAKEKPPPPTSPTVVVKMPQQQSRPKLDRQERQQVCTGFSYYQLLLSAIHSFSWKKLLLAAWGPPHSLLERSV